MLAREESKAVLKEPISRNSLQLKDNLKKHIFDRNLD